MGITSEGTQPFHKELIIMFPQTLEYEWQYLPVYVGGSSEAVWELEALDPPWRAGPATQDRGSIPPSAFTLQPREGQRLAFEIHG